MKKKSIPTLALAVFIALPLSGAEAQSMSDADKQKVAQNLAQADANGDTMLTLEEFETLLQLNAQDNIGKAAQVIRFGRQNMAFNRIDADRNGLLTKQEAQALAP